jgi:hypothetical protein
MDSDFNPALAPVSQADVQTGRKGPEPDLDGFLSAEHDAPSGIPAAAATDVMFSEFSPAERAEHESFLNDDDGFAPSHGGPTPSAPAPVSRLPGGVAPPTGAFRFFKALYWQQYFDVDTTDVIARAKGVFLPFPNPAGFLARVTAGKPDFYMPFWISVTLAFLLGVVGNILAALTTGDSEAQFSFDFDKMRISAMIIFGYLAVLPAVVRGTLIWMKAPGRYSDILCLYGYSMLPFLPAVFVSFIPLALFTWAVFLAAAAWSTWFLFLNVRSYFMDLLAGRAYWVVVATVVVFHVLMTVPFRVYCLA